MNCRAEIVRITEMCTELEGLVERSRGRCDNPEFELILCVVHDSVHKMRRAVDRWGPRALAHREDRLSRSGVDSRRVN
jgi:hypothetical protein